MHAEYPIIDDDGQGEKVEHVGEVGPDVSRAVLARAFGVEAVCLCARRQPAQKKTNRPHLGDRPRLVISPDQLDPIWIS